MNIPRRLRREPLLEAAWLIRYELREYNDLLLLPGALHAELRELFPILERKADLPLFAHHFVPPLRHLPFLQMRDAEGKWLLDITSESVILRNQNPYVGWAGFAERGRRITEVVKCQPFVKSITGGGLRYVDFFHDGLLPSPTPAAVLSMNFSIGGEPIDNHLSQLRWRKELPPFQLVFTLFYPAELRFELGKKEGLLMDTETTFVLAHDADLHEFLDQMQKAHDLGHEAFFRLLRPETIQALDPEYA